jgi:hypothetical protein
MLANQDQTQEKSPQKSVQGEPKPVRGAAQKDQQAPSAHAEQGKPTRNQQVLFGIPQLGLSQVERVVPVDEPPPLPANNELQYIGKSTPRYDGVAKVTGRAQYTADVRLPGMLYGRLVGADVPHARVKSIDVSAAQQCWETRSCEIRNRRCLRVIRLCGIRDSPLRLWRLLRRRRRMRRQSASK